MNKQAERQMEKIIDLARQYWQIRYAGNVSEARSVAHDKLIDAMRSAGIECETREVYALVAHEMIFLDSQGFKLEVRNE